MQSMTKLLHVKKRPTLLLKVDIAHAFDSVARSFHFVVLQHLGFPRRWIDWVAALLSTANTKILLNGMIGERICHARGLRQGDPLSPMLFLLVMEVLSTLICKVDAYSLWHSLGVSAISHRASLYADDFILFISPMQQDLRLACSILSLLEKALGLAYNLTKCQMAPTRCGTEQLALALMKFPRDVVPFPSKYLGIPLSIAKLPKVAFPAMVDQVADRLPTWKGRLLRHSRRLILFKTILQAMPIYVSISLQLPPWVIKALEKIFKAFL
jgi:hypothetical protein